MQVFLYNIKCQVLKENITSEEINYFESHHSPMFLMCVLKLF